MIENRINIDSLLHELESIKHLDHFFFNLFSLSYDPFNMLQKPHTLVWLACLYPTFVRHLLDAYMFFVSAIDVFNCTKSKVGPTFVRDASSRC